MMKKDWEEKARPRGFNPLCIENCKEAGMSFAY
jgi:hypothetical protein